MISPAMRNAASLRRSAQMLSEALPFLHRHAGRRVVVKYGGHAMGDESLAASFADDIALLQQVGVLPIVVHGGGPQIERYLGALSIQSRFVGGLRVTDAPTMEVVEMVLAGLVNKQLTHTICMAGARAIGLSGKDAGMMPVQRLRLPDHPDEDLGQVGVPDGIDSTILETCLSGQMVPVIAPVGFDPKTGQTFNINADTAAGAIACAVGASRLLLLTDVPGVRDGDGELLEHLSLAEARRLLEQGVAGGGMRPKLEICIAAIEGGVEAAVIMDGRQPRSVLLEMFTRQGCGTLVTRAL